jgi:hypothetical protein
MPYIGDDKGGIIKRRRRYASGQRAPNTVCHDPLRLPAGMTPRLLSREAAATYLGISPNHFHEHVADAIPPISIGRRNLWDVKKFDRWLDQQSGLAHAEAPPGSVRGRLNGDQSARG